jgi:catalase
MEKTAQTEHQEKLSNDLIAALEKLFGMHAGFRPVHAKGTVCSGTFQPAPEAAKLTRAKHVAGVPLKTVVRFSNSTGIPNIADGDPNASPRGIGVRFYLGEHVHTDIIGHSHNGFPTRTGEEFLEMVRAIAASGPDTPKPTPIETFMANHPAALHFSQTPNPNPKSYTTQSYFAVTAFKFTNAAGVSHYGRFQIHPADGNEYLDDAEAKTKGQDYLGQELGERLAKGPVRLRVLVEIAEDGDNVSDATITWPAERRHVDFGTITLTAMVPNDDPEAARIIFDPIPRIDGIDPSDDPLIDLRSALYLISGRRRRAAASK